MARRPNPRLPVNLLFGALVCALPLSAAAGEPVDERVFDGQPVATCGWPSVGAMGAGGCMGTLIHPQIAVTSGPCGINHDRIIFGETVDSPGREYEVAYCRRNPAYVMGSNSQSYCVLTEPVTDIPIVPVAVGCETGIVAPGAPLTMVGFGSTSDGGPTGTKTATTSNLLQVVGSQILHNPGGCVGDSGAPTFVKLAAADGADDTWRLLAVADDSTDCTGSAAMNTTSSMIHPAIAWMEEDLGGAVDLTPCHDPDGTWNPGPECQLYPLDPGASTGTWADGCDGGPRFDGYQELCGLPYDPPPGTEETGGDDAGDGGDAETTGSATEDGGAVDGDDDGGGGCSVAGAGNSAAPWMGLVALLGLGRRRRR